MSPDEWHVKPERKSLQLRKRKLTKRSIYRNDEDRLRSLAVVLQFFILTDDMDRSALMSMGAANSPQLASCSDYKIYSKGILYLGVENFLSTAVTFCHDVAREGRMPIVSVGSGDGSIERKIAETYRERYGTNLDIILVDPDPKFEYIVHYRDVDELIEKRPGIIGHCSLLIIWPVQQANNFDSYDIEAVRTLLPYGLLTVYESNGGSGSQDFIKFLRSSTDDFVMPYEDMGLWNHMGVIIDIEEDCDSYGLDHYEVHEVTQHKSYEGVPTGTLVYRMAIATRVDPVFFNACPALNWSCRRRHSEFHEFLSMKEKSMGHAIGPSGLNAYRTMFNMKLLGIYDDK